MNKKKLLERLKAKGLNIAEEVVEDLVVETLDWVHDEIANDGKLDWKDMFLPAIPLIKKTLLGIADKIDPSDNMPDAVADASPEVENEVA